MFRKFFSNQEEMPTPLRAIQNLQEGNYPVALKLFNEYLNSIESSSQKMDKDDAMMYYNRNIVKTQMDDVEGAIEDLNTAISIDPSFYQAISERGRLHLFLKRYPEAIEDYSHCLGMDSSNAAHYLCQRGYALVNSRRHEEGINDFVRSYEMGNKEAEKVLRENTNYFNR